MPQLDYSADVYNHFAPAPVWRRLAAGFYDFLLLAGVWFITTGICVSLFNHLFHDLLINNNGVGQPPAWFLQWVLFPLLVLETWGFYAWFWLHGGQTLGMRSWKLETRHYRGSPMTLWQTVVRFFAAVLSVLLFGAGYWLAFFEPGQTLHDRLSLTQTRVVPKAK